MRVVWLVVVCVLLVLPSFSQQRSLDGSFPGDDDGEVVNVRMEESDMFEWTGLGARASQVWFTPDTSGSILEFQDHHKHKSPPPPSPSPPPLSPPPPSPCPQPSPSLSPPPPSPPPPPPPLANLATLDISNGAVLVPAFDPDVHTYTTTVGEHVSEVRVTVSVPSDIQVYELTLNSSKLISGEESPPVPIGENGETVDLVITIVAPSHSSNSYSLSVHRSEKSSIWWKILKKVLIVVLVISVVAFVAYLCFSILRTSSWSFREISWWPFGRHQGGYQPVNPDP